MIHQQLTLLIFGFIALSALHVDGTEGVRMCGRRLADLLNFICERHGGFHTPRARRDVSNRSNKRAVIEILRPMTRRTTHPETESEVDGGSAAEVDLTSGFHSGVVDECCKKQCTLTTLVSYCANARHIGNIDLDEILPPGSENVPSISEEDLAEYELQQESAASSPESADSRSTSHAHFASNGGPLSYSSRPNLGLFMRNRPVFIVLSQLQEDDEDRALGEYRF